METVEIKNPKISITLLFFLIAVISFIGIMSSASHLYTSPGILKYGLILTANIGFWGMVYRVSKHAQFYLKGRPGASFFRIVFVASFVIVFILLFSFTSSTLKNSSSANSVEEDPYSSLKKEIESQKNSDQ